MEFKLVSEFKPAGDQPEAIKQLTDGLIRGDRFQTLLGVTGSGKTFTIANVIAKLNRPVLVLSHNKTLAAQLYGEFKTFFPENAVEYFVSYYDYYQPEAYLPVTDTYIEKDLSINDEIEKLRLSATSSLLSGRRDVIVGSSVSCLYGIGNPQDFYNSKIELKIGQKITRNYFLRQLVDSLYSRNDVEFKRGTFRVKGDSVDVFLAYGDRGIRIIFWGDEIETIEEFDPFTGNSSKTWRKSLFIRPTSSLQGSKGSTRPSEKYRMIWWNKLTFFKVRVVCLKLSASSSGWVRPGDDSGVRVLPRYRELLSLLRWPSAGNAPILPARLFPWQFYYGNRRKPCYHSPDQGYVWRRQLAETNAGGVRFQAAAAIDNRPLRFEEFEQLVGQTIYVSATPADYELTQCQGVVVDQVVRPLAYSTLQLLSAHAKPRLTIW